MSAADPKLPLRPPPDTLGPLRDLPGRLRPWPPCRAEDQPLWKRRVFWDLLAVFLLIGAVGSVSVRLTQPLVFPVRHAAAPAVDPKALEAHVQFLAEECVPRHDRYPENLNRAADYITRSLGEGRGRVRELDYDTLGETSRVILARYGPEGPVRVVVGAHYDACGSTPGADDNASGVAGLIELGRLLGEHPPGGCVELAAYPHEEDFGSPVMGSAHHAKALRAAGENPAVMISLEMIGCFSDEPGSQTLPARILKPLYPDRGNFVAVVGRDQERPLVRSLKRGMAGGGVLPVRSICPPVPVPGLDLSDHYCFWKEWFPAVMVTDTAFFRNPRYHDPEDTADTLDYSRMAEVVRGVYAGVRALAADAPASPGPRGMEGGRR